MIEQGYRALDPEFEDRAAGLRRELRWRGVDPRAAKALLLRLLPAHGRRRTLEEIAKLEGYSKARAWQLLARARDRLALSHQLRPLPDWLVAEVEAMDPRRRPLISLPLGELPVSVLRLRGVRTAGIEHRGVRTLSEVQKLSDAELLLLPGMGPRSVKLLRHAVSQLLRLRDGRSTG